jgi:cytochrome P450
MSSPRLAPSPPADPVLGHLLSFRKDALGFLMQLAREYGGVVRFRLGPKLAHLVTTPDGVARILQDNYKNYAKGRPYARARFAFGEGLITTDGDTWRRRRKLAQPAFHKRHFTGFASIMMEEAERLVGEWSANPGRTNVAKGLRSLALRVTARSLFTTDIESHVDALERAFNEVQLWFTSGSKTGYLVPPSFPTPANLRLKRTLRELDEQIYALIRARRTSSARPSDLLTMLMEARDEEDGQAMSDAELRDETVTLLFAAHESTASTMTWTLFLLSKYPEVERRVREEAGRRGPSREGPGDVPYTRRVIEETLRLYPAAAIIPREVLGDDVVSGYAIPSGSVVFISPYVSHRDPAEWENPEAFDPDRFLPEAVARRHKFAYMPFVLGPRQCIGNHFAMIEMLITVPMIAERFRYELMPGLAVKSSHLRFNEGMWMVLSPTK